MSSEELPGIDAKVVFETTIIAMVPMSPFG